VWLTITQYVFLVELGDRTWTMRLLNRVNPVDIDAVEFVLLLLLVSYYYLELIGRSVEKPFNLSKLSLDHWQSMYCSVAVVLFCSSRIVL